MKALITGASSGIGREMAIYLSELGYDLILVGRDNKKMEELGDILNTSVKIFKYDLSDIDNCYKLCDDIINDKIDVAINNAGFGLFGNYMETNLDTELNMIDLNVKALHILTKFFINNNNTKYILNVASSAGLMKGGPLMATYYATKSYVCSYSTALYEELRKNKSNKVISVLCPGPVDTNFNNRANVKFNVKSMSAKKVARYAINKMFKKKLIIVPGFGVKLGLFFMKFVPTKLLLRLTYKFQVLKKTP